MGKRKYEFYCEYDFCDYRTDDFDDYMLHRAELHHYKDREWEEDDWY